MKTLCWALLACVCLFGQEQRQLPKRIDAEELTKLLDDSGKYFFLDVREPSEIAENGSVKGYVNIPINSLESRLSEVPKDKKIVTICEVGMRADRAFRLLVKHEYDVVASCGLKEYREKKKPLVFPEKKPQ